MMLVASFHICWLVFVFTKIAAALVNNDIDTSDDYGLLKGLSQMKDTTDFRFTKFLDIRFDVDNNTPYETEDTKHPRMDIDPKCIQIQEKKSKISNHQDELETENNVNKYLLERLDTLTHQIQNLSGMLIEMNDQIRKNISHVSENQISVVKDIQNISESSNGVTYDGLYPKIEPGGTTDNQTVNIPTDCGEIQDRGNYNSGVYQIHPKLSPEPFLVLCDMQTRNGGWTHIQKRIGGSQDFYLGWREYKSGFGDLGREFWLSLEKIYFLTSEGAELLIEMVDLEYQRSYAHYEIFKIGPESDGYPISNLTGFSGDAGDALRPSTGQKFTTKDFDQDRSESTNCAEISLGAWWYPGCYRSDLNGKFIDLKPSGQYRRYGPEWVNPNKSPFKHNAFSLFQTRMLVKQTSV